MCNFWPGMKSAMMFPLCIALDVFSKQSKGQMNLTLLDCNNRCFFVESDPRGWVGLGSPTSLWSFCLLKKKRIMTRSRAWRNKRGFVCLLSQHNKLLLENLPC